MSSTLASFYPDVGEPSKPTYPTDGLEPLSNELDPNGDGKQVYNPPRPDGKRSPYYSTLYDGQGAKGSKPWFDFHVYHLPNNPNHVEYARKLYEAVRREFPELRVYRCMSYNPCGFFFESAIGPHPIPMFEVNVFNTEQLGTLMSWFIANRGPCSVLIHPNTGNDVVDHTTHATWLGEKIALDVDLLRAVDAMNEHKAQAK